MQIASRVCVLLVVAFVLFAVTEARQLGDARRAAIKLMRDARKHTKPQQRAMRVQQQTNTTTSTSTQSGGSGQMGGEYQMTMDPACMTAEALTWMNASMTKCANEPVMEDGDFSSADEAKTAWTAFCSSACYNYIQANKDHQYMKCFGAEGAMMAKMTGFMCSKEEGELCAVSLAAMDSPCERAWNKTACSAMTQCSWSEETHTYRDDMGNEHTQTYGYCEEPFTKAQLTSMCSPCVGKLLADPFMSKMMGSGSGDNAEFMMQQNMMCQKAADGQFCMLVLKTEMEQDTNPMENTDSAWFTTFCANDAKKQCLKKISASMYSGSKIRAREEFKHCTEQTVKYSDAEHQPENLKQCAEEFFHRDAETEREMLGLTAMCAKNTAGLYCMPTFNAAGNNSKCAKFPQECTTECDAEMKTGVELLGCCLGLMHEMMAFQPERPALPSLPEGAPAMPSMAPMETTPPITKATPGSDEIAVEKVAPGGMFMLGMCPSLNATIGAKLSVKCGNKPPAPIKKEMPIKIPYSKIKADPVLEKKLLDSATTDVASKLGLPPSNIQNQRFVENTKVRVTVATRRMRTLADEAGTTFEFEIVAEDAAETQAASAEFDNKASSNEMTLESTAEVASTECTGCVSSDQSSSLVDTTQLTSAASHVATLAAVVVAALALLF